MRFAIIGADGQLGTDLVDLLDERGDEVTALTLADVDIRDHHATRELLARVRPEVVVNTAAFHAVDACETRVEDAFAVNVVAVRRLAESCAALDATLVQMSTDYVFNGGRGRTEPFTESDAPDPQSVYAVSRLAGEQMARITLAKHFVVRTCGLYGRAGRRAEAPSFVEKILGLAEQGRELRVVDDQRVSPTFTADLAAKLLELVATGRHGLYHIVNSGSCTWYELARRAVRLAGIDARVTPVPTSAYPTAAPRPAYSVLAMTGLERVGLAPPRPWQEALADYMRSRAADER